MIIVKLDGGLGNQMFQYSLGRKISILKKVKLKLDINYFEEQKLRKFELDNFKLNFEIASRKDIYKLKAALTLIDFIPDKIKILLENYIPIKFRKYLKERNFYFNNKILNLPKNIYLEGFWQSEKYFKDIRNILLEDFKLLTPFDKRNMQFIELIKNVNSVSIHVRRGDYISNPQTFSYHGVCSKEYYKSAISFLSSKIKKPYFFIFSDDIEWVKNNLNLNYPMEFIDYNFINNKNCNDLFLMSYCKHNIIANSSFSWWAAWLNRNPNKIVIAPKRWFANQNINTKDLIPESWIKI